jgi:hypothetical protein
MTAPCARCCHPNTGPCTCGTFCGFACCEAPTLARTAAALLTADPPEIAVLRADLAMARRTGQPTLTRHVDTLTELLATVDYLRGELAEARRGTAS